MRINKFIFAFLLVLPMSANAATVEKFNLQCKASKVELSGTDTWGENLYSKEREDAWLGESIELAMNLSENTYCLAKYCTPETYGGPENIAKIEGKTIILDIRPKKEHESNDYNVISSDYIFDKSKMTLTDYYKYHEENGDKILGHQKITYSCVKAPFKLYTGE